MGNDHTNLIKNIDCYQTGGKVMALNLGTRSVALDSRAGAETLVFWPLYERGDIIVDLG